MIALTAHPHERVEVTEVELGLSLEEISDLPWMIERVASVRPTRVGYEILVGPFVGRLVVPDYLILDIEEIFPGTLRACLAITTGGRRGGHQSSDPGAVSVRPWDLIIERFTSRLLEYVQTGPEKRYMPHKVVTTHPRGRIDIPATATKVWSQGRTNLLACDVRVLTEDTNANRTLLAATIRAEALALQQGVPHVLRSLRTASIALSGARLEYSPSFRAAQADVSQSKSYLEELVSLAELIVSGVPSLPPPRLEDSPHPMSAWLNAEKIFEEAVRRVVSDALPLGSVRPGLKDGVKLLSDIPGTSLWYAHDADPDVVVEFGGRTILLDAKYRRHGDDYSMDELYQLMAHARAYRAQASALVTPSVVRPPGAYPIGRDSAGTDYYLLSVDPSSEASIEYEIGSWTARQVMVGRVPS